MKTKITFQGQIPSKKNSKRILHSRDGRAFLVPSPAYLAWIERELPTIEGAICLYPPYSIVVTIYAGSMKSEDLTNKAESLMDLLVTAKIIEDDNYFAIQEVSLKFGGVDVNNPRAEVDIESSDLPETIANIKSVLDVPVKEAQKAKRKAIAKEKKRANVAQTTSV